MRIVIFGTGAYYEKYKKYFHDVTIIALLDNSSNKIGKEMDGVKIHKPIDVLKMDFDRIYVLSFLYQEMTDQLISMGISKGSIFYFYDIAELDYSHRLSVNINYLDKIKEPSIAIISDDFKFSGAQFVLMDAVSVFINAGYSVVIASPVHGKMEEYLHNMNVPIIIDERIAFGKLSDIEWLSDFSFVFVNTMTFFHLLLKRDMAIPVLLWLHEPEVFYGDKYKEKIYEIMGENLYVYAVSNVAKKAWIKHSNLRDIDIFTIGRKEIGTHYQDIVKQKNVFLMVGEICELKGQRILCNALEFMRDDDLDKIEIHIVGRVQKNYDISYLKKWENKGIIKVIEEIPREELELKYEQCEVLICASKADSLPTVVIEAMQHYKPSIVSDAAGIIDYLEDMENAIIFPSENARILSQKMLWCIQNKDLVRDMGRKARAVYESFFTMEIFEKNLLKIVKEIGENKKCER